MTKTKSTKVKPSRASEAVSRLFDMPYSATAPRLINPELGLHNLVARAGHNAGYLIDVTLLDAPDHRLIRSGVLLAHRVVDGRGEWYLGAPEWAPLLPEERIEPMGHTDIPQEFADLIAPFRRRATLGPVAALSCERREFALRDDRGHTLALLRDDRVTVRRGGLTTARYREVTLTPIGPGLTAEQQAWLTQALLSCGSTEVEAFPPLPIRLGAPATGLTDFPVPKPSDADTPFAHFVSALLAARLREILEADLAVRVGRRDAAAELGSRASLLDRQLAGLSAVMDPGWTEDLDEELEWIAGQAETEHLRVTDRFDGQPPGSLADRLRGERYLTMLDRLVNASRAPRLGDSSTLPTGEVVRTLVESRLKRLRKLADRVRPESSQQDWDAVEVAAADLFRVCEIAAQIGDRPSRKLTDRIKDAVELLSQANRHARAAQGVGVLAEGTPPTQAFEAGRRYEQELVRAEHARAAFLQEWSRAAKKLDQ
ncbi:hypothetical protein GCM10009841_01640 [Microlunatus panaciterrae]|uniref:CHAD domain-containing protein n=1 Tax=Microlunatus panaciterrae TaxID=400768 RepID=A0ABS2RM39_9ACTN|nr:hypothetical protein [Microlunatus panaciterrae]MBM7799246.1 hypothetical protein [Microlunatus panaciterrae]